MIVIVCCDLLKQQVHLPDGDRFTLTMTGSDTSSEIEFFQLLSKQGRDRGVASSVEIYDGDNIETLLNYALR